MKTFINKAEQKLADLYKSAPKMNESSKESLAKASPWLALAFGVLQILTAWWLYSVTQAAEHYFKATNIYSAYFDQSSAGIGGLQLLLIYIGALVLLVDGIILLIAYPKLKQRLRRGWDLLFLASLINLAYGLLAVFINARGTGTLLGTVLGSAIAFYLLFQIQNKFAKK